MRSMMSMAACLVSLIIAAGCFNHGSVINDPERNEKVIYYLGDYLDSAHLITDSQGTILHEERRYPYGLERQVKGEAKTKIEVKVKKAGSSQPQSQSQSASAVAADYVFTGKEYDAETGLIYFGGRYYSPFVSRWITPDPLVAEKDVLLGIDEPLTLNLYAFARNNPASFIDRDGLWDKRIHYGSGEFGGTLRWAQDVGFSRAEAEAIGQADNDTDGPIFKRDTTGPFPWQDPSRHFNTSEYADSGSPGDSRMQHAEMQLMMAHALEREGRHGEALDALGMGLHSVQDATAHRDEFVHTTFGIHHHLFSLAVDKPEKDVLGYEAARMRTREYLLRFIDGD